MSIKDEVLSSRKLSTSFRMAVERLDDHTDPNKPLFEAVLKLSDALPLTVSGAKVNDTAGIIKTAGDISLNGLKNLIANKRVLRIEGDRPLHPEGPTGL